MTTCNSWVWMGRLCWVRDTWPDHRTTPWDERQSLASADWPHTHLSIQYMPFNHTSTAF